MTKKKRPRGRPKTGRVKITAYVLPATVKKIRLFLCFSGEKWHNTIGKVIDAQFGLG